MASAVPGSAASPPSALLRIGLVDMGSNAVRFQIAEVGGGAAVVLDSHRLPLRLGQQVFDTGQLSEETMALVVDHFRRFRANCDRLQVKVVRAIATAAMREATNRELLLDRLRQECGIDVDVITGTQEAYLLQLAVSTRIDLTQGRSLLVDVGGGSVEVVVVQQGAVVAADSYRLGALRMLKNFAARADSGERFVELLNRHLRSIKRRIEDRLGNAPFDRYVAVGGNIESLADLLAGATSSCAMADLRALTLSLASLTLEQRIASRGLRPDRADTIVPAGLVYLFLGSLAGVSQVQVPRVGIKDGLMQEVASGHLQFLAPEDHAEVVLQSCRAMGHRFRIEADHAEVVRALARRLFDETRNLHGLDDRARVLLEAAALLHDVGVAVNNDGHHKHSQYLIQSSELVGLSDEERGLVAMLARYHRKAPPSREHDEFARLRRKDRTMVERLCALLRLADALDRQHAALIKDLAVIQRGQVLELHPCLDGSAATLLVLEQQAVAEKGELFQQLFGKRPLLVPATGTA